MSINKIAILSPIGRSPEKSHGGITPVIKNLCTGFSRLGCQVHLLCEQHPAGIFAGDIRPILKKHNLTNIQTVKKYLEKIRPEIVLCAGHRYNKLGIWVKMYPQRKTLNDQWKLFLSVHNSILPGLQGQTWLKKKQRFCSIKQLYPRAQGIVAVSTGVRQELVREFKLPPDKIKTIYNPLLDLNRRQRLALPAHPWLQDRQGPVILAVGRLARQKDFATLCRSLVLVRKKIPARLIILGEGEDRKALTCLTYNLGLSNVVDLPGFVTNVLNYMAHADLFVLSSLWEGFGNVIVEALSVGLPVVSTDCPSGPGEILSTINRQSPCLVPPGDHKQMARGILNTLTKPPDKKLLLQRARDFSLEKISKQYLEYFSG